MVCKHGETACVCPLCDQETLKVGLSAVDALVIQRFKGALTTGYWPNNPEPLVRCANGDFVKHDDCKALCDEASKIITEVCQTYGVPLPEATLKRLAV